MNDLSRLCIHTATTKPWSIEIAVEQYARAGVGGISVWRDTLNNRDHKAVGKRIHDAGLRIASLCRGGFFPSVDPEARRRAIEDNLRAVAEAEAIGAPQVVLVCGAEPKQSLEESRAQIADGIRAIAGRAAEAGIQIAIEPLHPMYCDTRSAVPTMQSANDMCQELNLPNVGVAADVYHIWWDPNAPAEIARCGAAGRLFGFHVCDWRVPTRDFLLDRGLMGDGCIDNRRFRLAAEAAGFDGLIEVEVFSNEYWGSDQSAYLERIIKAFREHV